MAQEPYRCAPRVFWIMDNGSSHRGLSSQRRLTAKWPNIIPLHTPVHASWLNQVEIYFSVIQRKVLSPNDFESTAEVTDRLLRFQQHYEQAAKPVGSSPVVTSTPLSNAYRRCLILRQPLRNCPANTSSNFWIGVLSWRNKACSDGYRRTSPVGSFSSNDWGLHDVIGNVWEWVEDCWHGDYSGAPTDGSVWTSGGDCGNRVLRGGSWFNPPSVLRSGYRARNPAGFLYDSHGFYGFRIARTLTPR